MPFQSDKQKRWMYANEPEIAREWSDRYGAANGGIMDVASDGNTRHDFANFTNGNNINVPTSFQARPQSQPVDLAYVTPQEQGILQSLKPGTPHEGPMGIPNYDSFDASGNYTSGTAMSAAETGSRNARDRAEVRASNIGAPKGAGPGVKSQQELDLRAAAINAGAGQRVNPGFFDSRTRLSPYERALAKAYRNNPNNLFAKKAYRKSGQGGLMSFLTSGGLIGNLIRGLGQKFGMGKKWDEPTYDMSEFDDLSLFGQVPEDFELGNKKISNTSFTQEDEPRINTHDFEGVDFNPAHDFEGVDFNNQDITSIDNLKFPGENTRYGEGGDWGEWFDTHPATGESVLSERAKNMIKGGESFPAGLESIMDKTVEWGEKPFDPFNQKEINIKPYSYDSNINFNENDNSERNDILSNAMMASLQGTIPGLGPNVNIGDPYNDNIWQGWA